LRHSAITTAAYRIVVVVVVVVVVGVGVCGVVGWQQQPSRRQTVRPTVHGRGGGMGGGEEEGEGRLVAVATVYAQRYVVALQ